METKTLLLTIGFSMVIISIIVTLCSFFGAGQDVYGFYIAFFVFIIVTIIVLPNDYNHITLPSSSPTPSAPQAPAPAPPAPSAPPAQ